MDPTPYEPLCLECGAPLRRTHRHAADLAQPGMRRYICTAAACGWQGLMPRRRTQRRDDALRRQWLGRTVLPLVSAAAMGALAAGVVAILPGTSGHGALAFVPGASDYGRPLPRRHPLRAGAERAIAAANVDLPGAPLRALALRHSCAWARPGTNPYRGTVEQALYTAALAPEVVHAIAAQVRAGQPVDRLEIDNGGIRGERSGRQFDQHRIAMTYAMTMCVGTRVNFVPGHHEQASLYEASDKAGNKVSVMIPDVCGNVSVLGERLRRRPGVRAPGAALVSADVGTEDVEYDTLPAVLDWDVTARALAAAGHGNEAPEPGTLACALAALAILAALSAGRGRRAPAPASAPRPPPAAGDRGRR
ncbi:MAG: hypothetical protein KGN16_00785 [Burkholderiales bacterium]|nr:hypothetical protein [Burkholderiales bacterium]